MDWRLDDLRLFVAIVDAGSFSAAARQLGVPRPSVSRRLASLESAAGVQLIWRTTRRMRLTDVGAAFYERCQAVLEDVDDAQRVLTEASASPTGTLRLSAPPIVGPRILADPIGRYLADHPAVAVDLQILDRVVDVRNDGYDMALRMGDVVDDTLVARRVDEVRRFVYAAPALLRHTGRVRAPSDLRRRPILQFAACTDRGLRLSSGRRDVEIDMEIRLRSNDYFIVRGAAVRGFGFAALPDDVAGPAVEAGELVQVLPRWSAGRSPVHLVYAGGRFVPPKVAAFLRYIAVTPPRRRGPTL